MARLNKSTGLFGMGGGKRRGAKSGVGDFIDQLKKKRKSRKLSKSNAKSRKDDAKDVYKYSKKDSIKAYKEKGMSRREAKDQTMVDAKAKVRSNRSNARAEKASDKLAESKARKVEADKRREAARASGNPPDYDRFNKDNPNYNKGVFEGSPSEQREKSPGGTPSKGSTKTKHTIKSGEFTKKASVAELEEINKQAKRAALKGSKGGMESYTHTNADGTTRIQKFRLGGERGKQLRLKNNIEETWPGKKTKNEAQEGAKVKAKSTGVLKSDTNKAGPKMEPGKEPYTENGVLYTWDRKNSVWRGDVKGNEGLGKKSRAVKKAKNGAKVTDPPKKGRSLSKKEKMEALDNKSNEMYGTYGSKRAESSKMIARSDNTKSNKVTVKGKEEAHKVSDNDYKRRQAVKDFNHEEDLKHDKKYKEDYERKRKEQWQKEDELRDKKWNKSKITRTVKAIKKANDGGKVSEYGRKHDRIRKKGHKLRAKSEAKFLSTIGNDSKAENMSQKKKERLRKKSDKLDEKSMSKFHKAKAIRRNK